MMLNEKIKIFTRIYTFKKVFTLCRRDRSFQYFSNNTIYEDKKKLNVLENFYEMKN